MANESPRPTPADDPLDALSDRVRAAQEAAERLVREATDAAERAAAGDNPGHGSSRRPPPRGYATPGAGDESVRSAEAQWDGTLQEGSGHMRFGSGALSTRVQVGDALSALVER